MPVYEYKCEKCGQIFEKLIRNQTQKDNVTCGKCGSRKIEKLVSGFACSGTERSGSADHSTSGCGTCSLPSCSSCK